MVEPARAFSFVQSTRGEEPLLIGMVGPPGGGKTVSALRLATGMQSVRKGPIVLADTEGGRSRKYSGDFTFLRADFAPPFRSDLFLEVIKQASALQPSAIIIDSLSDEHEGEGGYLEMHDAEIERMGGNEWAAWAKPKALRKRFITGLLQVKVPLIFTFRAREKTSSQRDGRKTVITNLGWMPVAPLEIIHSLDLTCVLPPRANGVPVWSSEKVGEDFIIKLPSFLRSCIKDGQLDERTGASLARWAAGQGGRDTLLAEIKSLAISMEPEDKKRRADLLREAAGIQRMDEFEALPEVRLATCLDKLRAVRAEPPQSAVLERQEIRDPFGDDSARLSAARVKHLLEMAELRLGAQWQEALGDIVERVTGQRELAVCPSIRETDILRGIKDQEVRLLKEEK